MACYNLFDGSLEQRKVKPCPQVQAGDIVVDGALRVIGAMEQHPLLELRWRVGILHIRRQLETIGRSNEAERLAWCRRHGAAIFPGNNLGKLANRLLLKELLERKPQAPFSRQRQYL